MGANLFSVVYFSRGKPPKRGERALLGDLVVLNRNMKS